MHVYKGKTAIEKNGDCSMPFCPSCGKSVSEEDSFCRACGQTLQGSPIQKPVDQAPSVPEVEQIRSNLSKHVRAGEKVLWTGRPEKTPFVVPSLAAIVPGLIFLGFVVFFFLGVGFAGAPWPFGLFMLLFFLIPLLMIFGGPLYGLMRYRNTEYMITDRRIITQTGAFGLDTRFVDLDKIQEVYVNVGLIDRMFGTGTVLAITAGYVYVGTSGVYVGTSGPFGGTGGPFMRPSLAALKEPYAVQKLLQEAIEKARMSRAQP